MPNALIVEDDLAAAQALTTLVERQGFTTSVATNWAAARSELMGHPLDVVLLDVFLPGGTGIDLLLEIPQERRPQVILVSGDESLGRAFGTMALQELHFVPKPIDPELLGRTLAVVRRRCAPDKIASVGSGERGAARLLGGSAAMQRVREMIAKVAALDLPVTIEGESGTGKELVALAVHEMSGRRGGPFVALNCGALPENLIDSELYGHTKGAFTGAGKARKGLFQQADRGTLFLDEITEMPVELQVRLLRTLETGRVRSVGSEQDSEVDVRVISATNRTFEQAIGEGRFREDLFHRLCVFPITMPPLRQRPEDIPLLAERFGAELIERTGRSKPFTEAALQALAGYSWPGNVRQLRNMVQRAFVLAEREITVDCLPRSVLESNGHARVSAAPWSAPASGEEVPVGVGMTIAQVERRLIEATLERASGDKHRAADILGISVRTLYNRLKEYGQAEPGDA